MLHPQTKLGEVKLKVSKLERSIAFYEQVIGLQLLSKEGNIAKLTTDGHNVLLILEEVENAIVVPERRMSGLYHFAILLPSREALAITLQHLVEMNVHIGQADHLVSEALYLSDPDGNGIEIYRDRPRTEWTYDEQGNVNMATIAIDWQGLLALAQGQTWSGLPKDTVIGHVHFHVNNMTNSKQFYIDVLGFKAEADLMRQMGALFVGAGGYHHHMGLNIWAGSNAPIPPSNSTGIDYFTIIVPNLEELSLLKSRLDAAGVAVENKDGALFLKDPNEIGIKLIVG